MSRKIDRALYGPSFFEVTLGAILSILLGAALAFLFLVFKPVEVVKELPKEEDRVESTVYYVEGKDDTSRDRQWMHKRQMLLDGTPGAMTLSEDEINASVNAGRPKKPAPKPLPRAKPGEPAPKPAAEPVPDELITHDVPNVRIHEGIFQVGMPANLNLITFSVPLILQAQGSFVKGDTMWEFAPTSVYLGSMPLHRLPGLTHFLINKIVDTTPVPDAAWAAWKRVDNVSLGGRLMHLTIVNGVAPASTEPAAETPQPAPASATSTAPTAVPTAAPATETTPAPSTPAATPTAAPSASPATTAAPTPATTTTSP